VQQLHHSGRRRGDVGRRPQQESPRRHPITSSLSVPARQPRTPSRTPQKTHLGSKSAGQRQMGMQV
jgi:hypothetical protein